MSHSIKYEDSLRYRIRLDDGESSSVWSDGGYTTVSGITTDTLHVSGANALIFDKHGADDANGLVKKELSSEGMDLNAVSIEGVLNLAVYLPSTFGIASIDARLVSDSTFAYTNYVGWSESSVSAGWNHVTFNLIDGSQTGDGVDWSNVRHIAVGVVTTAASGIVDDVRLDSVWVNVPIPVKTV